MNLDPADILLIEDDLHDVELTLHALQRNQLANRIRVARDGAEALEVLLAAPSESSSPAPHLILLDLHLPKVDGLEVLRRIKADPRTRLIPVVILTASRAEQDVAVSYDIGVNSYIVKPVDFDKFAEVVRRLGFYWLVVNQRPTLSG